MVGECLLLGCWGNDAGITVLLLLLLLLLLGPFAAGAKSPKKISGDF
jgi:hypothetical protein